MFSTALDVKKNLLQLAQNAIPILDHLSSIQHRD
jgi:hypothetical protein